MITLKPSINGMISVIIFKRTMTNISFNITYLQDNYLGTYVSMNEFMTDTQMVAVLTRSGESLKHAIEIIAQMRDYA